MYDCILCTLRIFPTPHPAKHTTQISNRSDKKNDVCSECRTQSTMLFMRCPFMCISSFPRICFCHCCIRRLCQTYVVAFQNTEHSLRCCWKKIPHSKLTLKKGGSHKTSLVSHWINDSSVTSNWFTMYTFFISLFLHSPSLLPAAGAAEMRGHDSENEVIAAYLIHLCYSRRAFSCPVPMSHSRSEPKRVESIPHRPRSASLSSLPSSSSSSSSSLSPSPSLSLSLALTPHLFLALNLAHSLFVFPFSRSRRDTITFLDSAGKRVTWETERNGRVKTTFWKSARKLVHPWIQ